MDITKQTYNLGRAYSALAKKLSHMDTPARRGTAALEPLKTVGQMIKIAHAQGAMTKELDDEITELLDTISIDYPEQIPLEEQTNWWIGYYHRKIKRMTIKEAREAAGLTQEQVAEKMGVEQQTFASWENGLRNPKEETRERIAEALGISKAELL